MTSFWPVFKPFFDISPEYFAIVQKAPILHFWDPSINVPLVNNGQKWCQKLCNIFSSLHLLQGESVTQSIGPNCIYLFQLLESSQIYAIIFHPPLFHDLENSDYCTTVQVYVQRTALPCTRCVRALYSISSSRKHSTSISSAAGLQSGCC